MPTHGDFPDEVLRNVTRAGGSWWLAIAQNRPSSEGDAVVLADIPAVEVPRDDTAWADPVAGQVSHLTGVTMPDAGSDTPATAWVLFDDEDLTVPRLSRWFAADRTVPAGEGLTLPPEVLTIEFTPQA